MDLLALNDVDGKAESEDEIISGIKQRRVAVVTMMNVEKKLLLLSQRNY